MHNRFPVFGFVVLGLLVSGCIQSSAVAPQETGGSDAAVPTHDFEASPDGVAIHGTVISEEIFPVPNAIVALDGAIAAHTDAAGVFEVVGVVAGTSYTIGVTAYGYEPTAFEVEVPDSGVVGLRITLVGIPGEAPYVSTYIKEGFDACSFSVVYSAGPLSPYIPGGCPFGKSDTMFKVEVGADWRAGAHELEWKTNEDMIFASSVSTKERPDKSGGCQTGVGHDWCPSMIWGRSPLRIFVRPNDTEYAKKYAIDGKEVWPGGENFTSFIFSSYSGYAQHDINNTFYNQCVIINRQFNVPENWGCPFGIGLSLGTRLTYYHTTFYLQAPSGRLEDFTALPDG